MEYTYIYLSINYEEPQKSVKKDKLRRNISRNKSNEKLKQDSPPKKPQISLIGICYNKYGRILLKQKSYSIKTPTNRISGVRNLEGIICMHTTCDMRRYIDEYVTGSL